MLGEIAQDLREVGHTEGEMTLLLLEMLAGDRDVGCEPTSVGGRHHEVLAALPDGDRHLDVVQVEPPRAHEREVVVPPAVTPVAQGLPRRRREVVTHRTGQGCLVDGPDQDTRIAQRVEVKVGIRRPGRVEITEGLQPGDMVVTAGQQRVQKDGMPVRVLDLNGKAAPAQPGAPAANGSAGTVAAAAPAAAVDPGAAAAAGISADSAPPKLDGRNPCITVAADAGAAVRAAPAR